MSEYPYLDSIAPVGVRPLSERMRHKWLSLMADLYEPDENIKELEQTIAEIAALEQERNDYRRAIEKHNRAEALLRSYPLLEGGNDG